MNGSSAKPDAHRPPASASVLDGLETTLGDAARGSMMRASCGSRVVTEM